MPTLLQVAVIDGHKPDQWHPWGEQGPGLRDLVDAYLELQPCRIDADLYQMWEPKFIPLLDTVDNLIAAGTVRDVVGVIFDPGDTPNGPTMKEKLKSLARLCNRIVFEAQQSGETAQAVRAGVFEIWFVDRGYSIAQRWEWSEEVRQAVAAALKVGVRFDSMKSSREFLELAQFLELNATLGLHDRARG